MITKDMIRRVRTAATSRSSCLAALAATLTGTLLGLGGLGATGHAESPLQARFDLAAERTPTDSTAGGCSVGYMLMSRQEVQNIVAGPGGAGAVKAADGNGNGWLCVKTSSSGGLMPVYSDDVLRASGPAAAKPAQNNSGNNMKTPDPNMQSPDQPDPPPMNNGLSAQNNKGQNKGQGGGQKGRSTG
jgi:hypothetical protein